MFYICAKRHLGKDPFSPPGTPPTILQKKKQDVRKVPDTGNRDGLTSVYWIDGLGIGAGCTVVIRVANSD